MVYLPEARAFLIENGWDSSFVEGLTDEVLVWCFEIELNKE